MFGDKQDDQTQTNGADGAAAAGPTLGQPFPIDSAPPRDNTAAPAEPTGAPMPADNLPTPPAEDAAVGDDTPSPADEPEQEASADPATDPAAPSSDNPADDLIGIKQQALQQLQPLVSHLDQTPEEKFKTTMMMLQATDDQSLVKTAYDTAQQIKDEKERAQALLDIINEINYFTNQKDS